MKHIVFAVFGLLLLVLLAPVRAQSTSNISGEDPLLGTWFLNVSKSTYKPGPPPSGQTRIYEKHPLGIRATVKTLYRDGRSTTVQSVYDRDKQEHPVTGSEDVDVIVMTRTNAYTHEATMMHAGREIGSFRREISKDGKHMTVTLRRARPSAENVEVYEKVVDEQ